jgi:hypothetical protein
MCNWQLKNRGRCWGHAIWNSVTFHIKPQIATTCKVFMEQHVQEEPPGAARICHAYPFAMHLIH